MWRQGDVFIDQVKEIPLEVRTSPLPHVTLVHGELTGHSHRVEDPASAVLFAGQGELWLHVHAERARVVHEEHGPIELPRGFFRIWRQREYTPQSIRVVQD